MMNKKLIYTLLMALLGCGTNSVTAQQVTGTWETIASYGGVPKRVIETSDRVYTLSQNNLSSFDKDTHEVYAYNTSNMLNAGKIADIFYNYDRKYLLISYADDNIDVLTDDGRTINFPEIVNASLTTTKTVNDVAFAGPRAYLATAFGLVVINVDKGVVEQSGIYGFPVKCVAVTSERVFINVEAAAAPAKGLWSVPVGKSISRFDAFTNCSDKVMSSMEAMEDNRVLGQYDRVGIFAYDADTDKATWTQLNAANMGYMRLQRTKNGFFTHNTTTFAALIDKEGKFTTLPTLPADLSVKTNALSCYNADASQLWAGNADGYGLYDLTAKEFTIQRVRPNGTSGPNVGQIVPGHDGSIYFMTQGYQDAYLSTCFVDKMSEADFINVSPQPARSNVYNMDIDPINPNIYAVAFRGGIARVDITDNTYTLYTADNSAISSGIVVMPPDLTFDDKGNLWFFLHSSNAQAKRLYFISKDAWAKGGEPIEMTAMDFGTLFVTKHAGTMIHHSSGLLLYTGNENIGVYDYNDTPENISDDKYVNIDQSGKDENDMTLNGYYINAMVEDEDGSIWVASTGGVRIIKDPKKMFEPNWRISRPKVARNDGTNLADFLLDNENVMDMCIDANNHKWFATVGSGLYHVSPDGTEILENFTTENSGLISDNVYAVYADHNSNKVYVGTDQGACVFHATSAPAAQNYSNVYAYPNPVTPDYTGMITITGLMDKSLVKIADSAGNVFHQDISDGGMVMWDGCDASGSRVKSGVYFVIASQNSSGSSSVVTKILVIN